MNHTAISVSVLMFATSSLPAQEPPSYARHVRPYLAKYCLECHNAKALKGGLSLETLKTILEGSDKGPVLVAGKPDESTLVTSVEGKSKPAMPPRKVKLRPRAEEIALVRAWVKAGAKDDSALIKVVIPDIKPGQNAAAPVASIAYQPVGASLAIGKYKLLQLVNLESGAVFKQTQPGTITALAYGPRGAQLAIAHGDPGEKSSVTVRGLDGSSPTTQTLGNLHDDAILDMAFSPDGKYLATSGYDMLIKLTPLTSPLGQPRTLKEHSDAVYGIAFSPDSKLLASCSADRALKIWDVETGKLLYTLAESTDWLYTVAWSPDGQHLASGGVDKSIRVYKVVPTGFKIKQSVFAHEAPVQKLVYSEDGKTLYSLGQDRILKAWNAQRLIETKTYDRLPETGLCLAIRGGEIAVGRYDGVTEILNAATGQVLRELGGPRKNVAAGLQQVRADIPVSPVPEIKKMTPATGRRGQTLRLVFDGKNLDQVKELVITHEGATSKIVSATTTTLEADVVFPTTTRGGAYEIRAKQGSGLSKPQTLIIDPFPVTSGQEGNNSPGTGRLLPLPASVVGKLMKPGDFAYYRFQVAKGQQLGVHIVTKGVGSKVEPFLELTDQHGVILAVGDESFLGYTFPDAGIYCLGIRDREFRGGPGMHYRVHLGEIPVVTSVFPLGLQRGTKADIRIKGVFLDSETVRVHAPQAAEPGTKIPVLVRSSLGKPLGKQEVVVGEFPEVAALPKLTSGPSAITGTIPLQGTANGILEVPGQSDTWRFTAQKGQPLILETHASRLGSNLDSTLEVLDVKGNPVPRAVLRCRAKTYLAFRDHDSATPNLRIETWSDFAVNDNVLIGGELLKIASLPTHPDADCIFFSAGGKRLGYLDTTPTHHAVNEPIYKVSVNPPGTTFPPNGYPVFTLFYRNDDGGPGYGRDSFILFDPPADGDYLVRVADARGQGGDSFGYRLTVRPPRPSFNVRFSPTNPVISRGGAVPIQIAVERLDGYQGPIQVRFEKLPPGFSAPPATIEPGLSSTAFALYADEDAKTPPRPLPLLLVAEAAIAGNKIHKEAIGATPQAIDPGDIVAFTEESAITVQPGRQVKLTVHIDRRHGFLGRVPLEVRGLPHGVRVLDIGLNGILVNENEVRRTIVIYAEPWVEASSHPFVVLARREGKKSEHAAKSVLLNVAGK